MLNVRYLELLIYRTLAGLRTEARQTYLSFLWWIIEPVMYMGMFYFVFGHLYSRGDGSDFVPFLLCGLTAWKWFGSAVDSGANAIKANGSLMGQVHVPKIIFPSITILHGTVKFLFVLTILLIFMQFYGEGANLYYLGLMIVLFVQLLLIMACAYTLAAIVPFVPDVMNLVRNALQLMFFLSGIFYKVDDFPETVQHYLYANPMVSIIKAYRVILIDGQWPNWIALGIIGVVSTGFIVGAYFTIKRLDRVYPKVV